MQKSRSADRPACTCSFRLALRTIEGDDTYEAEQKFYSTAAQLAREGRLSRFVYVAEKRD